MPIHDWTRVDAGIFHDFHHAWIEEIRRGLNRGILPPDYYAMAEQIAGGWGPDVLTLQTPESQSGPVLEPTKGISLTLAAPKVRYRLSAEPDLYAAKANAVTIRHSSNHRVVAIVEVVSPGNKNSNHGLTAFVEKAVDLLKSGIHLLILDLFPPGPRNPQGMHRALWDEFIDNDFALPADKPLTLASYQVDNWPTAFVEPVAVGDELPDMPLFLSAGVYVLAPLGASYQSAWEAIPTYWRDVVAGRSEYPARSASPGRA